MRQRRAVSLPRGLIIVEPTIDRRIERLPVQRSEKQEPTPQSRAEFSFGIKFRLPLYHKHAATSRKIFFHGKCHGKKFDKTWTGLTAQ